jgi:hypothetical protein
MTLIIINSEEVARVLTKEITIAAPEESYKQLVPRNAVCRRPVAKA